MTEARLRFQNQLKSGANNFYWIAALSLINSVMTIFITRGASFIFVIGLGITQFVDGFCLGLMDGLGGSSTGIITAIALILDLGIAILVVLIGVFARKKRWIYIVGMSFYALDALIFLLAGDIMSILFHVFILFCLMKGFGAFKKLADLEPPATQPTVQWNP